MKSVISALVIFIIIIVMLVISCMYTESIVNEMLQSLYKNENYIAKNDWGNALAETEFELDLWKNSRNIMVVLFNHSIIERIDASISKINNAVKLRKKMDFLYETKNFELLLKSLTEQQEVSIGNIL